MYKMIFKAALMLGIVLGISNYMLYIMTGKSPFSSASSALPNFTPSLKKITPKLSKETVYKWTDENGRTHYSSDPIPGGTNVEEMEVDPNVNVMDAVEIPKDEPSRPPVNLPEGNIYHPEKIKQLVDDARNVQDLMNERNHQLESM